MYIYVCIYVFVYLPPYLIMGMHYVYTYIIYVHVHVDAYVHLKIVLRTNVLNQSIFSIKKKRTHTVQLEPGTRLLLFGQCHYFLELGPQGAWGPEITSPAPV